MRSVLFFGLLSYFLVCRIGSWRGRVGILLAGGALVLMIGVSRVYLEAHGLSDVLAGYAAGMAWLGCAIVGITKIRRTGQNHIDTSVEEKYPTSGPARATSRAP
jgi:membrane-associated phospholipid phosphatase